MPGGGDAYHKGDYSAAPKYAIEKVEAEGICLRRDVTALYADDAVVKLDDDQYGYERSRYTTTSAAILRCIFWMSTDRGDNSFILMACPK